MLTYQLREHKCIYYFFNHYEYVTQEVIKLSDYMSGFYPFKKHLFILIYLQRTAKNHVTMVRDHIYITFVNLLIPGHGPAGLQDLYLWL